MKVITIINKIFLISFFILGIIIIFFDLNSKLTWITAFGSFLTSFTLGIFLKNRGIDEKYMILINIGLILGILGEIWFYYHGVIYYDKFLHFTIGMIITIIVYYDYFKNLKVSKLHVFFTVLGMLAGWEIFEYIMKISFNFPMMGVLSNGVMIQSPLDDTMYDLVFGALGSLSYLLFKNP